MQQTMMKLRFPQSYLRICFDSTSVKFIVGFSVLSDAAKALAKDYRRASLICMR